jgi:hypothetical protein
VFSKNSNRIGGLELSLHVWSRVFDPIFVNRVMRNEQHMTSSNELFDSTWMQNGVGEEGRYHSRDGDGNACPLGANTPRRKDIIGRTFTANGTFSNLESRLTLTEPRYCWSSTVTAK